MSTAAGRAGRGGGDVVVGRLVTGAGVGGAAGLGHLAGEVAFVRGSPVPLKSMCSMPWDQPRRASGFPVGPDPDPDVADGHRGAVVLLDDDLQAVGQAGGVQAGGQVAGHQAAACRGMLGHGASFQVKNRFEG